MAESDNTNTNKDTVNWVLSHPEEEMRFPKLVMFLFLPSVLVAVFLGARDYYSTRPFTDIFGNIKVSGLSVLESISLVITFVLAVGYTIEVFREASNRGALGGANTGRSLLVIGIISTLNCGVIGFAIYSLLRFTSSGEAYFVDYIWYLTLTFLAFLIFVFLDFLVMSKSRGWKIARSYWGLLLFCDGPAAIAFGLLLLYIQIFITRSGTYPPFHAIGGAVAMQLMIANAIYLIIATNTFFKIYKKYVCNGIEMP